MKEKRRLSSRRPWTAGCAKRHSAAAKKALAQTCVANQIPAISLQPIGVAQVKAIAGHSF